MQAKCMTGAILAAFMLAGPAFASSIEVISGKALGHNSILTVKCPNCPAAAPRMRQEYIVPQLSPGSQTAEMVDVNGEKRLKRVENWMGGSPVVIMTSATGWSVRGRAIVAGAETSDQDAQPLVDQRATTSAISTDGSARQALNAERFELRLN